MLVAFQKMSDLAEILGGITISMPGKDGFDEVRITCIEDLPNNGYKANYAKRSSSGFVYGGQAGCAFGVSAAAAMAPVLRNALNTDDAVENMEFEIFEMRDLDHPSIAELIYGSEAWNAFDRGHEVR